MFERTEEEAEEEEKMEVVEVEEMHVQEEEDDEDDSDDSGLGDDENPQHEPLLEQPHPEPKLPPTRSRSSTYLFEDHPSSDDESMASEPSQKSLPSVSTFQSNQCENVKLFFTKTGLKRHQHRGSKADVYVATACGDNIIRVWNVWKSKIKGLLIGHKSTVTCLTLLFSGSTNPFSKDGD